MSQGNTIVIPPYEYFSKVTEELEKQRKPSNATKIIRSIVGGPIAIPFQIITKPISIGSELLYTNSKAIAVSEDESKILEEFDTPEKQEKIKRLLPSLRDLANKNPNYTIKVVNSKDLSGDQPHKTLLTNTICFSENADIDGLDFRLEHEKAHVDGYHSILSVLTSIVGIAVSVGIIVMTIKQMRAHPERRWKVFFSMLPLYIISSASSFYADIRIAEHFKSRADALAAKNTSESQRDSFYESLKNQEIHYLEDQIKTAGKVINWFADENVLMPSFSDLTDDQQKELKDRLHKINLDHHGIGYDREQAIRAAAAAA